MKDKSKVHISPLTGGSYTEEELAELERDNQERLDKLAEEIKDVSFPETEVKIILNKTSDEITQLIQNKKLVGLTINDERWFPSFQFTPLTITKTIPGLHEVIKEAYYNSSNLSVAAWFLHPCPALHNLTPAESLKLGKKEEVHAAAHLRHFT